MFVQRRLRRWLLASAGPLALGALDARAARAQSLVPIRGSSPPRPARSLPPRQAQRRAKESPEEQDKSELVAPPAASNDAVAGLATPVELAAISTAELGWNAAAPPPAEAAAPGTGSAPEGGYFQNPYLTTDWWGARSRLQKHGIDVQGQYTAEGFSRFRGGNGVPGGQEYMGGLDLSVDVDTGTLAGWKGGSFNAHVKDLHGSGITEKHVGSLQSISNLEGAPIMTLAEYWFRQELIDGHLAFKVGKQDAATDFAASQFGGTLLGSSFGAFPTVQLPTFPDNALGVAAVISPVPWFTVRLGAFDGAPDGSAPFGGTSMFGKDAAHHFLGELQFQTGSTGGGIAATLRLGGWYHDGDVPELPTEVDQEDPGTLGHNEGAYAVADIHLYRPPGEAHKDEGLGMFLQAGHAADDRNEVSWHLGGGLAYTGLLPTRSRDVLSAGVGHALLSPRIRAVEGRTAETILEITYKAQLVEFLSVQPNLQHIVRPGGSAFTPDATVAGVRVVTML